MGEELKKKTKKGGARPGAGRPKKIKKLSNYDRAIKLLDDNIEESLNYLADNIKLGKKVQSAKLKLKQPVIDKDDLAVIKLGAYSAEVILKKSLPDRIDLKNEYKKEAAKVDKDLSKLSEEELNYIVNGK